MNLHFTSSYLKAYRKIIKKNSRHPSLRLHKLEGGPHEDWSISIEKDIRILFSYVKDGIVLVDVGKHDDIY